MDGISEQFHNSSNTLPVMETFIPLKNELQFLYSSDCDEIAKGVLKSKKIPPLDQAESCFAGHPLYTLFGKEAFTSLYATQGKKIWENYTCGVRIQEIMDINKGSDFLKRLFLLNNFNTFVTSDKERLLPLIDKIFSDPRLEQNFLTIWENIRQLPDYTEFRGDVLGAMHPIYGKDMYTESEFATLLQKID